MQRVVIGYPGSLVIMRGFAHFGQERRKKVCLNIPIGLRHPPGRSLIYNSI